MKRCIKIILILLMLVGFAATISNLVGIKTAAGVELQGIKVYNNDGTVKGCEKIGTQCTIKAFSPDPHQ